MPIADCQLPIANFESLDWDFVQLEIDN